MPKKNTKYVKTTTGTTRKARGANSIKLETTVANIRSVNIGVKNVKRWLLLKKRLGFVSDDDLAVHLLDLADNIDRHSEKRNAANESKENRDEEENSQIADKQFQSCSRRSPRKQLQLLRDDADQLDVGVKSKKIDSTEVNTFVDEQKNSRHKSKHHRSKTKHHKDKRKKKKHPKNIESAENIIVNNSSSNNEVVNNLEQENNFNEKLSLNKNIDISIDDASLNVDQLTIRGTRDESVIQKTEKIDNIVIVSNLDSEKNINENFVNNDQELIDNENNNNK